MAQHRALGAAVYGSVAMVKPSHATSPTLSKSFMRVRATSLGITSFDFGGGEESTSSSSSSSSASSSSSSSSSSRFVAWAFSRSQQHCDRLLASGAVAGCSFVSEAEVRRDGYLTYCERVYLDPASGLGPDWDKLLPAKVFHVRLLRPRLAEG